MKVSGLATDYDGTIARDGVVADHTIEALEKLKRSGRSLIMVTGRELDELIAVCPRLDLFEWVVAENGARALRAKFEGRGGVERWAIEGSYRASLCERGSRISLFGSLDHRDLETARDRGVGCDPPILALNSTSSSTRRR